MEEADVDLTARSIEELLAFVLRVPEPASDLVERVGGIEALARSDAFEIAACLEGRDLDELGRVSRHARPNRTALAKARAIAAAFELGRRMEIARARPPAKLASAAAVAAWATPRIAALAHEELWMLALDGRGHLRAARCVARGGLHGAAVRASDPLRAALRVDASAFVLVHNHPSGDPTPSKEDVALTAQVAAAAEVAGIVLLDHVVVARTGFACVPLEPARHRGPVAEARSELAEHRPSSGWWVRYISGMKEIDANVCGVCGGDGRLENAWGQVARCPSCGGSGKRREDTGFHDVTKTKEAHHRNTNRLGAPAPKQTWPSSISGAQLATEIKTSSLAPETKERLTREIIDHEATHGECTKTFLKKVRKQIGPLPKT